MGKGRKKKNITPFKDFESVHEKSNYEVGYIRMVDIQLICMNELSANAFRLYIMMKSYAKGNKEFSYPHRIYKTLFCNQTFKTARQELIDYGYIEQFCSQKSRLEPNKYVFSSKWRERNKERISEIIKNREKPRRNEFKQE